MTVARLVYIACLKKSIKRNHHTCKPQNFPSMKIGNRAAIEATPEKLVKGPAITIFF